MHLAQEGVGVRGTSVCRSWCAGLSVHTPDASIPHLNMFMFPLKNLARKFKNGCLIWPDKKCANMCLIGVIFSIVFMFSIYK